MKKAIALFLLLFLLLATLSVGSAEGVTVIGSGNNADSLQAGETITIDKLCDVTLLGYVADDYAMSIPAYSRPDDELFLTPEVTNAEGHTWGNYQRYKYESYNNSDPYAIMYVGCDLAAKASTDDYKLLDVRLSILNRMISPMDTSDTISAVARYMDEYEFPLTQIRMEATDTLGNKNEWLVEAKPIPTLVDKTIHLIFEVPNIVATSQDALVVAVGIDKEEYEIVIR